MAAWLIAVTLLAAADGGPAIDCERAQSMKDQRLCGDDARQAEGAVQDAYEGAMHKLAETPHGNDQQLFDASQKAWLAYRKAFCEAISAHWGNGSIRDQYYVGCMKKHADSRKQEIEEYISHDAQPATPAMPPPPPGKN
ncbi:MAG TPA: lysozyme inhibitor LprI family protein [Nevskiaceae bacterium]|nr:lysozyme inhibitor LprI family protein [Nevskiaceae bacterium]